MLILRDYQESTLAKLREEITTHQAQMLYAPTGAGKTEMAIALMQAAAEKKSRVAMVMDRRILCDQTSERLDKYGIPHGVMMAGHWRYRPGEYIQICSAQTLESAGMIPSLRLLIYDEAHAQRKFLLDFIRARPDVKVIGLSASPFTKNLGNTFTKVVNASTTRQLVETKMLAPLRVFIAKEIDMDGAKKVAGEWSQNDASERGIKITGDVVSEWTTRTMETFGRPVKTLVFCAGVGHGADLAEKFAQAGFKFINISYRDDDEFKQNTIRDFSRSDTEIHGLIATDVLSRGFDVPDVLIGCSVRPFSKSFSSHVQQMGRVMRSSPGKGFALWLDFSGNYLRFRNQWDDLYENGVDSLSECNLTERVMKEPTEEIKDAAKCPQCHALWPGRLDVCSHCGYVRKRRNDVIELAGRMEELKASKNKTFSQEYKTNFYAELLGYCEMYGKKPGMAHYKYVEKFGESYAGKAPEPIPPSQATASWVKSRLIRYRKRRAA